MPSDKNNHKITERIEKRFAENTNILNISLHSIAPQMALAAEIIVSSLLNENKLLICGEGSSSFLSQYMASLLINRFETDRPALPAIALTSDISAIFTLNENPYFDETYSRQIYTLGQEKDILIVFLSNELTNVIMHAINAAHEKNMIIILICADTAEEITHYMENHDKIVQIPTNNQSHILEVQLLILHSICDLIDHLLFGTP
jgi:D-sedoheptulose 7-phosphate isomerase